MKVISTLIAISAMLALPLTVDAGDRAKAEVGCKATGDKLVYDCMIMLMDHKSGDPIPGASIVVKADMPSMPMAHNVAPVDAMAMGEPGSYHARIKLEMHGEWALTMDISGPMRDRLVEKLQFGEMGAMKPGEGMTHAEGMKHGDAMQHGETKPKSE